MRATAIMIGAAIACIGSAAFAGEGDEMCVDRPGKSSQACTVGAGRFQIETGLASWSVQKGGGERDTLLVIGETTLVYGLDSVSDVEIECAMGTGGQQDSRSTR